MSFSFLIKRCTVWMDIISEEVHKSLDKMRSRDS